jgi:4-hydroxyphenylpyruvate dioxygenase
MSKENISIKGIHHIELFVGNAKQAAYYYRKAFGFSQTAYSGLETGNRNSTSYVLSQGSVKLVLTTPLHSRNWISNHIQKHGDGVYDIAFQVDDVDFCFNKAIERGAEAALKPYFLKDANGTARRAAISTYGNTIHSFISKDDYNGAFLPHFEKKTYKEESIGLHFIDHVVGNVEVGQMNKWANFYSDVLGFKNIIHFTDKDISTKYSALMSKVMENDNGRIKFPINEPAEGLKKSQIEEFLKYYEGPGAQHIALLTDNIIDTITKFRERGVEFLHVPDTYYDDLESRVGPIKEDIDIIRKLGILVDRDDEGYLLQLFTKPVEDRPTLFYEIIQRKGSKGFGQGNFQALFESIEREQALRGNL